MKYSFLLFSSLSNSGATIEVLKYNFTKNCVLPKTYNHSKKTETRSESDGMMANDDVDYD